MTAIETGEAAAWQRARDGDAQAFAAVFDLHQGRVYAQAARLAAVRGAITRRPPI